MSPIRRIALCAVLCMSVGAACTWSGTARIDEDTAAGFARHVGQHRRVVVLPFAGDDENPQLASRVRESFYGHFSPKKYHDVELRDIDAMLEHLETMSGRSWRKLSPPELGTCFNADYLVYGRVLSTDRIFAVFYSQLAIDVEIRLVETGRGRTVWKGALKKRLHNGDLPMHPVSLVTAAVRTGADVSDERMQDLIERVCHDLASRIPEPRDEIAQGDRADIQVASFTSGDRAVRMVGELQTKGYGARVERVSINGTDWYRVLVGPYGGSEAESARQKLAADHGTRPLLIYAR